MTSPNVSGSERAASESARSPAPVLPSVWSGRSTASAPSEPADSTSPCDCSPKFPERRDPPAILQSMQRGIGRPVFNLQNLPGPALDCVRNGVPMRRPQHQRLQNRHVQRPLIAISFRVFSKDSRVEGEPWERSSTFPGNAGSPERRSAQNDSRRLPHRRDRDRPGSSDRLPCV